MAAGRFFRFGFAASLLAGCARPPALPGEAELPIGPNQDCGCLVQGDCATIEAAPGWSEVRSVSCRWIETGSAARCGYESRRVDREPPDRGGAIVELSPWRRGEVTARRYERGWCAE